MNNSAQKQKSQANRFLTPSIVDQNSAVDINQSDSLAHGKLTYQLNASQS